jgi:hypothetical protein
MTRESNSSSQAEARHHVVITGTGRAGTSFLVHLLTLLGLDTGFTSEQVALGLDKIVHAGLEHDVRNAAAPYIVKNPHFCDYAQDVLHSEHIQIDHIFVPYRDITQAAKSRERIHRLSGGSLSAPGGLWHTEDPDKQEGVLYRQINKLFIALSEANVLVTLIAYPKLVIHPSYTYTKFAPILGSIDFQTFFEVFSNVANPGLIHSFDACHH